MFVMDFNEVLHQDTHVADVVLVAVHNGHEVLGVDEFLDINLVARLTEHAPH